MARVELPQIAKMTADEKLEAQNRIAATPAQVLEYMHATQRQWLVLNAEHWIKALESAANIAEFQQMVALYRHYRQQFKTGRKTEFSDPRTKQVYRVDETYQEQLDVLEISQAITYLARVARELDTEWVPPSI